MTRLFQCLRCGYVVAQECKPMSGCLVCRSHKGWGELAFFVKLTGDDNRRIDIVEVDG